jgi:hypothetical protein
MNQFQMIAQINQDERVISALSCVQTTSEGEDKGARLKAMQTIFMVIGETARNALKDGQDVVLPGLGQLVRLPKEKGGMVRFRASNILKSEVGVSSNTSTNSTLNTQGAQREA